MPSPTSTSAALSYAEVLSAPPDPSPYWANFYPHLSNQPPADDTYNKSLIFSGHPRKGLMKIMDFYCIIYHFKYVYAI